MKMTCHQVLRLLGIATLATALLGCSTFAQQNTTQENCYNSRLLLTDLTQTHTSKAMLPNGEACPSGVI